MRIQWWWDATFTGSKSSNQMFSSSSGTTGNYEWCTKGSFGRSPAPRAIHSCKPNPAIYLSRHQVLFLVPASQWELYAAGRVTWSSIRNCAHSSRIIQNKLKMKRTTKEQLIQVLYWKVNFERVTDEIDDQTDLQGNTTTRCTWCYISIAIYTNNTNCIHYTVLIVFHDWLCEHLLYISNILRFSAYNEMDTGQVDRWSIEALFAENIVQNHYHLSISLHKTHTRM